MLMLQKREDEGNNTFLRFIGNHLKTTQRHSAENDNSNGYRRENLKSLTCLSEIRSTYLSASVSCFVCSQLISARELCEFV